MEGSLVCLSSDMFQKSIIFGVITNRQITVPKTEVKIWEFSIQLDFDLNNEKSNHLLQVIMNPMIKYMAIESLTYFEGMRHTLSKLKEMDENFPLKRYIVDLKTDIECPPYLNKETVYDLSCVAKHEPESGQIQLNHNNQNPLSSIKLLETDCEVMSVVKNSTTFDIKQFEAFYSALTKQFAIIQGPPGTGKTFVGLKIVKCLLDNKNVWNRNENCSPILIVCYKNHALDQFLEGILNFTENIVRIGGKSESQALKDYKLTELREKVRTKLRHMKGSNGIELPDCEKLNHEIIKVSTKISKISRRINAIKNEFVKVFHKIKSSFKQVIDFEDIKPYIKRKYIEQLSNGVNGTNDEILINWLNVEKVDNFEKLLEQRLSKKKLKPQMFDEVLDVKDINELTETKRMTLYLYWRENYFNGLKKIISEKSRTLKEEIEKSRPKKVELDKLLCRDALIIGLTITGAAKYRDLVEKLNPKIMIVEEAAEVLEGHVIAAMPSKIEHLILIGDHQQLRPITNVRELTDDYKLDISLFERMVDNGMQYKQLTLQHRMRPCISQLLKVAQIYEELRNDSTVTKYPEIKFINSKNMFFLNHNNFEESNNTRQIVDKSRSNLYEAKFIVELVKYFLLRNYSEDKITVLTTYNAQLRLIKNLMIEEKDIFVKEKPQNTPSSDGSNVSEEEKVELKVRVSSVDGFQGEENDIIIISFVRSSKKESIGFLGIKNRVCVALSRARHGLFCVGNFKNMAKQSDMWKKIVDHLKNEEVFGNELIIGCNCSGEQLISMPNQFALYNLQTKNRPNCDCDQ
jgi:superfamily I DNA and/or RNA helicase